MNIGFQCGFVKAALDYGVNPLQAVQLLKLAALNYLNEQGRLDDELMLNAILQNQ